MAVAAIAGLTAVGGAMIAAQTFAIGFTLAAGAFALGAGLSMVSRALMPKVDYGQQMTGLSTTVREPASSRKIVYGRARVGGSIVYMDSTGTDNEYFHMVIAIAGHEIDAYEEVYFNDQKIWDGGSFVGSWGTYVYLGLHDGSQTTADSTLVNASTQWTTNHKLLDTAYMYVRLKYDQEQFANGLPNVSAVIRGKKVYNPSTSTTAWSQNPALIVRDYLLDSKYGLSETSANINSTALSTAQTICDQDVSLQGGGTQKRFTCDGVLDTANSIQSNIEALLSSMIGKLIHSGGEYFITASAYVTPTVTIDESTMVAPIQVATKQSRRSLYNGVKGVFNSEDDNYITSDYPPVISSTYSAADGDPIYLDLPLPFTTNHVRAQRIAKRILLQSRQQTQITVPCNLSALKFKAGDTIMISNTKLGWSQKVFEVVGYNLDFTSTGEIIVNVDALETASAIYDWTSSDEEDYLSGGEVTLYDGRTVASPTAFTSTAGSSINLDGVTVGEIVSTWTASADAFVVKYEYQWSTDNTNWNSIDVEGTRFTLSPTLGSTTYYTRVRAVNDIGVKSTFISDSETSAGDTTAPALPSSISATAGYKSISLSWTNPSDKDFSNVEVYRSTSSSGSYSLVATVAGGFSANANFLNGGLADSTAYYYKFKSVDYTGNKSVFTSVVNATTNAEAIDGQDGADGATGADGADGATGPAGPTGPAGADGADGADGATGADGADGAAGVRNAAGYVYYSVSQTNAPNAPTATSYNFGTGAFGGLTSNWSRTPPTNTGGDAKYWATSYYVTEATYGGTQTIAFGSAFNSVQFDGLVTFTNLNTELADASSTEITTINGGLVSTGTIDVSNVNIAGTASAGINIKSADTGSRMEIASDVIKIYDGSVLRVKLGNL